MGLKDGMKSFDILGVHWKIRLLGGKFTKNQDRGGLPKRGRGGGAWTVYRFKGGGKKEGGGWGEGWYPNAHYAIKAGWRDAFLSLWDFQLK